MSRAMLLSVVLVFFVLLALPVCSLPVSHLHRDGRRNRRILDPAFHPEHGRIISPRHLVLKVDCPDCPLGDLVSDDDWNQKDATLIYDLVIPERISQQVLWKAPEPRQPGVHTNFYPPGPFIGATPFTRGVNVVGPPSLTVDDYLAGDSNYVPLEVPGIVGAVSIPNRFGWNITRVSYINGLCYANGPGQQDLTNVPVAFVYLLHRPNEQMEIIWWELQDVNEFRVDTSVPKMPPLLDRKLLHDNRAWLQPQCDCRNLSDQMARWLVFGVLAVVMLIVGAYFEGRVVQGRDQGGCCDCEIGKSDLDSCTDSDSVDEELEERLERHP
ncbi:hypothetical protein HDK90DRAFT_103959 [Phyllosticta capitalensis]|uniref:Uncharacterized protein n=1 Tax=Phyllosticta capitalensis TaxID=121624 RepID=A0ABR1YBI6_9PEZI